MGANEKVNILLVDDQPARLLTYQSVLGELGQNLVCAQSGLEALDKLMREEFAVVLLDVSMPDMDGFELIERLRRTPEGAGAKIVVLSSLEAPGEAARRPELGIGAYLRKPVKQSELLEAIQRVMGMRGPVGPAPIGLSGLRSGNRIA